MWFETHFSISLSIVFRSTIGLNTLGAEYDGLPGLGIITNEDSLKKVGQCPCSKQALARLTTLAHVSMSTRRSFRWDHVT
jgi:hypothetical protein